jgi:prophage regulatory protein
MTRIYRRPEVKQKTGLSSPTIWRLERRGLFPPRRQLSPGAVGYDGDAIDEWIRNRPLVRRQAAEAS